jgi:2-methylcitrate dehydratase
MSPSAQEQLKLRLLDSAACAAGALRSGVAARIRSVIAELEGGGPASLIGGGRASPDRAAFHNGALVRYLDRNDSYLSAGETCHPSDSFGPILAAAEFVDASGRDFLSALAAAYQIQCRLSDETPAQIRGFDQTAHGASAAAAGVGRVLRLSTEKASHAIAIAGVSSSAFRFMPADALSNWRALAAAQSGFVAVHAALLARSGLTGPTGAVDGAGEASDSLTQGRGIDWESEDLESVRRTILKKYDAEIHSQSAIEAAISIHQGWGGFPPAPIESVRVDTFQAAYDIIGRGTAGPGTWITSREVAGHSLPYLVAVALLDGEVSARQYTPECLGREDVRTLTARVEARPDPQYSARFPGAMPARITVRLADGSRHTARKSDYDGFSTRPLDWDAVRGRFRDMDAGLSDSAVEETVEVIRTLEQRRARDLGHALAALGAGPTAATLA